MLCHSVPYYKLLMFLYQLNVFQTAFQLEPYEKEEEPMIESPIFSPIPESSVADSSDTYYTAQEEIEEEILEPSVTIKISDRHKRAPSVPEKIPEIPELKASDFDFDFTEPEEEEPEETREEVRFFVYKSILNCNFLISTYRHTS